MRRLESRKKGRQRKNGGIKRLEKQEEKRIEEEQWKKGNVLGVEVSAIWPVIAGIVKERNQCQCPQIDLRY